MKYLEKEVGENARNINVTKYVAIVLFGIVVYFLLLYLIYQVPTGQSKNMKLENEENMTDD